jgi:hypothetical protein
MFKELNTKKKKKKLQVTVLLQRKEKQTNKKTKILSFFRGLSKFSLFFVFCGEEGLGT